MPAATLTGGFADAVAEDLPPDTEPRGAAADPIKVDPVVKVEKAKPEAEADVSQNVPRGTKEEPAKKEVVELENPNLRTVEKPVVEASAVDDDEIPKGMTTKALETWKTLKADRKALQAERDAQKGEIQKIKDELAAAGKGTAEAEQLRKDLAAARESLAAYESEISVTRIEATPLFKKEVTRPLADLTESMSELAKRYEIPPENLMRAIQEPNAAKRSELIDSMTEDFRTTDRYDVVQAARDHARIQKVAADFRADAGKKLESIERQTKEDSEKIATGNITAYRTTANDEWKAIQERYPVLRTVEGNEPWNSYLTSIVREIESVDVNDLPVGEVAKMKAQARALPELAKALTHYQTHSKEMEARVKEMEALLKDYRKTAPGAGTGANGDAGVKESPKNFIDGMFAEE